MSKLPEGWDEYNPEDHERSDRPTYIAARGAAAQRAERRRAAYGEALAALRRARSLTQVTMAAQLGIAQGEVSRIEHQADLLLSTLTRYVEGMGGELALLVRFGDDHVVELGSVLNDLLSQDGTHEDAVVPDPATALELAGFIGRYDYREEQFRALATP
jgi:transcriptional regulator with XRE-family HTH domain